MIPAKFDYTRPSSLGEATAALASGGEDAKVIAGGQSLLPLLRLRFSYPSVLVDVGGLDELRGVRDLGDSLEIGALTTHYELTRDPLIAAHCGLLAEAAGMIADPAVRHRGTIGGALAHADPAGDLPAVITALDATMVAAGAGGTRSISPADFFVDYLTTTLAPGEILTAIRVPKLDGWGYRYEKFNVTAQAWAIVGVAAVAQRANGQMTAARVGLTNMGSVPVRARAVEEAAAGSDASAAALASAAAHADAGTNPPDDLRAASDYRRHLARVLTGRALAAAAGVS
jgi:aerobic carbon-monoxide dehydrogenase medium subunit